MMEEDPKQNNTQPIPTNQSKKPNNPKPKNKGKNKRKKAKKMIPIESSEFQGRGNQSSQDRDNTSGNLSEFDRGYNKMNSKTVMPRNDIKKNFEKIFDPLYQDQKDDRKLDYYFDSYSTYHIHEEMLQDEVS